MYRTFFYTTEVPPEIPPDVASHDMAVMGPFRTVDEAERLATQYPSGDKDRWPSAHILDEHGKVVKVLRNLP